MNRLWLNAVCSKDPMRSYLSLPMRFDRDDKSFTIATDGQRMVELPEADPDLALAPEQILIGLRKYLAPTPATAVPLDFESLRTFIREATKGTSSSRLPVFVYVGGALFNARLFLPMVKHIPPTLLVRWHQQSAPSHFPSGPALVDGGDWRFLVMPMLDRGGHTDIPRFEIEGAQAAAA